MSEAAPAVEATSAWRRRARQGGVGVGGCAHLGTATTAGLPHQTIQRDRDAARRPAQRRARATQTYQRRAGQCAVDGGRGM